MGRAMTLDSTILDYLSKDGLLRTGHFRFRSGRHSSVLLDRDRLLTDPVAASRMGYALAKRFFTDHVETVASPSMANRMCSSTSCASFSVVSSRGASVTTEQWKPSFTKMLFALVGDVTGASIVNCGFMVLISMRVEVPGHGGGPDLARGRMDTVFTARSARLALVSSRQTPPDSRTPPRRRRRAMAS